MKPVTQMPKLPKLFVRNDWVTFGDMFGSIKNSAVQARCFKNNNMQNGIKHNATKTPQKYYINTKLSMS